MLFAGVSKLISAMEDEKGSLHLSSSFLCNKYIIFYIISLIISTQYDKMKTNIYSTGLWGR